MGALRNSALAVLLAVTAVGCGGSTAPGTVDVATSPTADGSSAPPRRAPAPERETSATRPPAPAPPAQVVPTPIEVPEIRVPRSYSRPVTGGDVSWPQCPKGMGIPEKRSKGIPMPLPSAEFVILGLTNGPAFTPNPCLADQVQWVKDRRLMVSAYAVSSYPDEATLARHGPTGPYDGSTRLGALGNVGYQQAMFNIATMQEAGLTTPTVWLDVEPVPVFEWSADKEANAAVVEGAARGYTDAGYLIGAYSTPLLWDAVVGGFSLGGVPEWRAAGPTSRQEALSRCGPDWSFQGGQGVIGQWVQDNRDHNVTCPGASRDMFRWFTQY